MGADRLGYACVLMAQAVLPVTILAAKATQGHGVSPEAAPAAIYTPQKQRPRSVPSLAKFFVVIAGGT